MRATNTTTKHKASVAKKTPLHSARCSVLRCAHARNERTEGGERGSGGGPERLRVQLKRAAVWQQRPVEIQHDALDARRLLSRVLWWQRRGQRSPLLLPFRAIALRASCHSGRCAYGVSCGCHPSAPPTSCHCCGSSQSLATHARLRGRCQGKDRAVPTSSVSRNSVGFRAREVTAFLTRSNSCVEASTLSAVTRTVSLTLQCPCQRAAEQQQPPAKCST